jgi:prepilin-type N-terminal cleavage/methylation domain-containing protein
MNFTMNRSRGLSLTELVIVLGIIGVLTAVVTASTGAARAKARDERRKGDLREIQLGLALYYDVNKKYPLFSNDITDLNILLQQKYLPAIPTDPTTNLPYEYMVTNGKYCLGAALENDPPDDSATCTSKASGSIATYKVSR